MAYGNPSMERDDDYFDDGPKKEMAEHGMDEEGILPKSLMAGKDFKPGDEIVLEVTRVGDKDFSVKYASEKGEKDEKMPEKETADMGGGGGSEMEEMY